MSINRNQFNINFNHATENPSDAITCGEFFAGGGGWTTGISNLPNIKTKWILNHDSVALKTNAINHKGVKVYWADIFTQDEHELEEVDYIHASTECDEHSNANAGKGKKTGSYVMGWELYRYLKYLNASVISIENVPEFKKWAPLDQDGNPDKTKIGQEFERWKKTIMALGYEYKESIRNAADDGLPTRRVRFFCFFYKPGIEITFPGFTHSATGLNGKIKHKSCRPHIDTDDHGISIFGRAFNEKLAKNQRKKLCHNSLKRIAGGIRKLHPDFYQFLAQYHAGKNPERFQSLDLPINTIDTSNRHQLITLEKWQFIADHCHSDNYVTLNEPISPVLTRQTKTLTTIDLFITQYYGGSIQSNDLDEPINTIPCRDTHQLITLEKFQFITKYFNNFGNPEFSVQSLDDPLSTVLTTNKHQLITLLDGFDIKARFLRPDELAGCSTFPKNYFNPPGLRLSHKDAVRLIGNAVPPYWAEVIMRPNVKSILDYKLERLSA